MRYPLAAAVAIVAAGLVVGTLGGNPVGSGTLRIAFASQGAIDEIDLSGGHRRVLSSTGAGEGFAFLADGSRFVGYADRLLHIDAHGRQLGNLGPGVLPAVSPDGSRLVVSIWSATREEAQLWIVNADGSGRRQLTGGALDSAPAWSPDGSTILFTRFQTHAYEAPAAKSWIETIPAIGGTPRRLTSSGYDSGGHYSPDGRSIVFGSARGQSRQLCGEDECRYLSQLYLMRADGSEQHRLTGDYLSDAFPVFANESTIVYSRASAVAFQSEIYRIESDGTCRRQLTRDGLSDALPTVIPGTGGAAARCPPAEATLPPGRSFDAAHSTLTPKSARRSIGLPLYWVGQTMGPFTLTNISVSPIRPPGQAASTTAYLIYACAPARGDCSRRLVLIMTPVCARPTFPATGQGAIDSVRGVPRIRYRDRDELPMGRVIVTIYSDRLGRELAERELRSLSASAVRTEPGQPLPAAPQGILTGLACQPPAIIRAPLPRHEISRPPPHGP